VGLYSVNLEHEIAEVVENSEVKIVVQDDYILASAEEESKQKDVTVVKTLHCQSFVLPARDENYFQSATRQTVESSGAIAYSDADSNLQQPTKQDFGFVTCLDFEPAKPKLNSQEAIRL
jgi:long-subunit acyl-CoA synthetase (AMP-forming)